MQIFIKIVKGETLSVQVDSSASVLGLKEAILSLKGIPIKQQLLVFKAKWLSNSQSLSSYGIEEGSLISLLPLLASI